MLEFFIYFTYKHILKFLQKYHLLKHVAVMISQKGIFSLKLGKTYFMPLRTRPNIGRQDTPNKMAQGPLDHSPESLSREEDVYHKI